MIKKFKKNKLWKKVSMSLLTLAMTIGMVSITPVVADNPTFEEGKTYAIIADGKAMKMRIKGYMTPSDQNNVPHMDGSVAANNKVDATVAFKVRKTGDNYSFYCEETNNNYLEFENKDTNIFTYSSLGDGDPRDHARFNLHDDGSGKYKIESVLVPGCYLKVDSSDGIIYGTMNSDEGTSFEFKEVQILDNTFKIESTSKSGFYLSYKDSNAGGKVKVVEGATNTEKFNPVFAECAADKNYTGKSTVKTIAFQAKDNTSLYIGGDRWNNGSNSGDLDISFYDKSGGWESLIVESNDNGTFSFRDPLYGKYVGINSNNELEGGKEEKDKEKFIFHTDLTPSSPTELKVSKYENDSITIKWNAIDSESIFSGYEVWHSTTEDEKDFKLLATVNGTQYEHDKLTDGTKHYYKIRAVLGNDELGTYNCSEFTDVISQTTRTGKRPAAPTGLAVEEGKDKKTAVVTWKEVEGATSYIIYRADSQYAEYEKLAEVDGTTSYTHTYNQKTKYNNYYKVVAKNGAGESEISDESVALEKNLFGDHTLIFAETDDKDKIDDIIENLFKQQNDYDADAQFKGDHYQVYFKSGDYTTTQCMNLGFYTSFNGLGKTPYDVKLNNVAIPAYLPGGALGGNDDNATCNFWRSAENLSIINTGNDQGKARNGASDKGRENHFNWAVAQAAPLRRIYSERETSYDWNYGWASGGYVADSYIANNAGTWSGQQFYTRNSVITGNAFGTTLNNFYQGVINSGLPTDQELVNGNGYSNWGVAGDKNDKVASYNNQQVVTNVSTTPKVSEKPFLFLDDDGEYKVFVPAMRENSKGTSWDKNNMGEGTAVSLDKFYIAKPTDSAATINAQIEKGMNIYFTPGIYHVEKPINVNHEGVVLLGTGMATIIPDNSEAAMKVSDLAGIKVAGLIFDAGKSSKYLLQVGTEGKHNGNTENPIVLQDLFFRIGGTTDELTKADNALEINSDGVICDHFWIWRADHGTGVTWEGNKSKHGLIVNGDDVTCYALFNEHFQEYDTLWNGENGATYFYQNEKCYDPIDQESWMSHNGTVNGYAAYKVSNDVKKHYAIGLGIYNVFIYTGGTAEKLGDGSKVSIQMDNAIEVPNSKGVIVENACIQTFANADGAIQKFNHIINGVGQPVVSGVDSENCLLGEGWSRKFIVSYQNGKAVIGDAPIGVRDSDGNLVTGLFGLKTIDGVSEIPDDKEPSEDVIVSVNKAKLEALYNANKNKKKVGFTSASWKEFETALANAKKVIANSKASQQDVDNAYDQLLVAISGLEAKAPTTCSSDNTTKPTDDPKDDDKNQTTKPTENTKDDDKNQTTKPTENTKDDDKNQTTKPTDKDDDKNQTTKPNDKEDLSGKPGDSTNVKGDKENEKTNSNINTGDPMTFAPYAILAVCAVGAYVVIKKKRV